jgi:hypothetical protein
VNLKEAVDHAATGNFEIDFELHGGGEVVELAKSVQKLTSLMRRKPERGDHARGPSPMNAEIEES